jgi:hypothetical protein
MKRFWASSAGTSRQFLCVMAAAAFALGGCTSSNSSTPKKTDAGNKPTGGIQGKPGYVVYWDQNEEVDFYYSETNQTGQLFPAWDLNGQVCILPDGSGRFVGGLDPTIPSQNNPGGLRYYKQPAIGEEMNNVDGSFSGTVLYVPGPYKLPGQSVGDDSPAINGIFNGQSTYTGCVFTQGAGNLVATDLGSAQGQFPIPTDGRLVEWFGPKYSNYCILTGPTQKGSGPGGPHNVDGTGGLGQPGMLAMMPNGDILMPVGANAQGVYPGSVMRIDHTSLPTSAAACPNGVYPQGKLKMSVFFQGTNTLLPFPNGVAYDEKTGQYAISSIFGNPGVIWVDKNGKQIAGHGTIPGETIADIGADPNAINPFGMAFAPDGTLFLVDIHIICQNNSLTNCGPKDYGGRIFKVAVNADGSLGTPKLIHGGFDFPTSVTICVPGDRLCPYPPGQIIAPASGSAENMAPANTPSSTAPAQAGFGCIQGTHSLSTGANCDPTCDMCQAGNKCCGKTVSGETAPVYTCVAGQTCPASN